MRGEHVCRGKGLALCRRHTRRAAQEISRLKGFQPSAAHLGKHSANILLSHDFESKADRQIMMV